MADILCLYYSRTGTTRAVAEQVAELLEAELVELTDGKKRKGLRGFLTSGMDAMKKTPDRLRPFQTEKPLNAYARVILATPVWAGRCSSVMHAFLATYGQDLPEKVSYIITHMSDASYETVFAQMDQYLPLPPYDLAMSLQPRATDWYQDIYDFARILRDGELPG